MVLGGAYLLLVAVQRIAGWRRRPRRPVVTPT
jgi:hypothetical protein